jgi:hypothetical protein
VKLDLLDEFQPAITWWSTRHAYGHRVDAAAHV